MVEIPQKNFLAGSTNQFADQNFSVIGPNHHAVAATDFLRRGNNDYATLSEDRHHALVANLQREQSVLARVHDNHRIPFLARWIAVVVKKLVIKGLSGPNNWQSTLARATAGLTRVRYKFSQVCAGDCQHFRNTLGTRPPAVAVRGNSLAGIKGCGVQTYLLCKRGSRKPVGPSNRIDCRPNSLMTQHWSILIQLLNRHTKTIFLQKFNVRMQSNFPPIDGDTQTFIPCAVVTS